MSEMAELAMVEPRVIAEKALVEAKGKDYVLRTGPVEIALRRNVDFGKFGKAKKPSLLKAGAEKILWAYGMPARYSLDSAVEDVEAGYFFYRFKCELVKFFDDAEHVIAEGYGSANTRESRNGQAHGFDTANSTLKMARKRAMVDAAMNIGGLSDMFTQDIEDETFMENAKAFDTGRPDDPITPQQVKRIYAIAAINGISTEKAKQLISAAGYTSTKLIKQKDYDALCKAIEEAAHAG